MHKHYFVGGRAAIANNIFAAAGKKKVEFRRIAQRHNNPSTADPLAFEKIGDDVLGLYRDRSEARSLPVIGSSSPNTTGRIIIFV
jgi:hypothetical protein